MSKQRDRLRAHAGRLERCRAPWRPVDTVLSEVDGGSVTAAGAIERLLDAQISLRNNRRLQAAMRAVQATGGQDPGGVRLRLSTQYQA